MCTKEVMYNIIAHHLLIDAHPIPEQWSPHPGQSPHINWSLYCHVVWNIHTCPLPAPAAPPASLLAG